MTYLRLNTSNAPSSLSFPDTFLLTKTPTQPSHVATKSYADNLPPKSTIQNTVSNYISVESNGSVNYGATGAVYKATTIASTEIKETLSKRRLHISQDQIATPMDVYVRNKTNANGLLLSSGYYDGVNQTTTSYPYLGVYDDSSSTITPWMLLDTVNSRGQLLGRWRKPDNTAVASTDNTEVLSKLQILELLASSGRSY